MELILIRHTKPLIDKGICYGQTDLELDKDYPTEFSQVLTEVGSHQLVYSSPLIRCGQLAEFIGSEVIYDDRIKEINFGDWEMQKWTEISPEQINPWYEDYVNVRPTNGESLLEMHLRVKSFLAEIRQLDRKRIICVTHAGVMRVMNAILSDIELKDMFELKIGYGQVIRLKMF